MKTNNLLIKFCIVFLTIARFATVIGMAMVLYFGIFENTDKYFTVKISRENFEQMEQRRALKVKAAYEGSVKEAKLKSSVDNYVISIYSFNLLSLHWEKIFLVWKMYRGFD